MLKKSQGTLHTLTMWIISKKKIGEFVALTENMCLQFSFEYCYWCWWFYCLWQIVPCMLSSEGNSMLAEIWSRLRYNRTAGIWRAQPLPGDYCSYLSIWVYVWHLWLAAIQLPRTQPGQIGICRVRNVVKDDSSFWTPLSDCRWAPIAISKHIKSLGVTLDGKLSFDKHVDNVCRQPDNNDKGK